MKTTAETYLAQSSLLRLLAVLALVVAPHLLRMPPWIGAAVVAIGAWRGLAAWRQWALPPTWLKVLMVLAAIAIHGATYGRINGQHAGTALFVVMFALKLTEMRDRRDVLVVVSMCYFMMLTHFLFSQEIWTILYLGTCAVGVTAILVEANHPGAPLPPRVTLRIGGAMVALAVPLMVALFVLFPRVPGPLWGLPADAGAARSGISDTMSPGDISSLIQSDEVAFRVVFRTPPPAPKDRYWRGPVLSYFDGRSWRAPFKGDDYFRAFDPATRLNAYETPVAELSGPAVRYEVTLEPHRQNWLFALDLPDPGRLPQDTTLTGYYQLLSRALVKERLVYTAESRPSYMLDAAMTPQWQRSAQRLPPDRNPRAVALARQWRGEGLDDAQVVDRALRLFRTEPFFYTLEPPTLGQDSVDDFLFETRRGFCEHYSSAFTVLMRAAGIPARVVVGYKGGELNEVGGYYVVRQSDAHAWSEVWLAGRGWVRVDPTAAVAPSRVESGLSAALAPSELPGFLKRSGLSAFDYARLRADVAWDYVNVAWDRWVLGFNQESQFELLSQIGLGEWRDMVIAMTVLVGVFMGLIGMMAMRGARPTVPHDEALRLWRRATRTLAALGLPQAPAEGPRDYAERIARMRPDLADAIGPLARAYLAARYLDDRPREATLELAAALKTLAAKRG
ncbi:MAG: transglutaminase TgpA family protein [Gammaproteobacteria bacterium]